MKALKDLFTPKPEKIRAEMIREAEIELLRATSDLARATARRDQLVETLSELRAIELDGDGKAVVSIDLPAEGFPVSALPSIAEAA